MAIINEQGYTSVDFPFIGSGTGMFSKNKALNIMLDALSNVNSEAVVTIVKLSKNK